MTSVLIAFVVVALPPPIQDSQRSIWAELSIRRTGNNGYEEYLDAIDDYRKAGIGPLLADQANTERKSPTYLQLSRLISEKMVPVVARLQQGNQKPVSDPVTDIGTATLFPHLAHFKNISKAISASVDAKFANGAISAAVTDIIAGLEFSDNASRGTLIAGLVGIANHAILFRALQRHWGQLSGPDAVRLEKYVNNYFSKPSMIAQIFQVELKSSAKILRNEVARSSTKELVVMFGGDEIAGDDAAHLMKEWESLTPAQRFKIADAVAKQLEERNAIYQGYFVKPEKEWVAVEPEHLKGLEGMLSDIFSPVYEQAINAAIKHRTQLRLLRLHALIRQYRFEHDRLPESLAKLNKPLEILDPVTGESFNYEPKADLQYELYGKGNAGTGRIDLVYRKESAGEITDPNAPPH